MEKPADYFMSAGFFKLSLTVGAIAPDFEQSD